MNPLGTNCLNKIKHSTMVCIFHHSDAIMSTMATQITSLTVVYSTVYWGADQKKIKSSASLPLWGEFTSEFHAQRDCNAENVSIWWRHHVMGYNLPYCGAWVTRAKKWGFSWNWNRSILHICVNLLSHIIIINQIDFVSIDDSKLEAMFCV